MFLLAAIKCCSMHNLNINVLTVSLFFFPFLLICLKFIIIFENAANLFCFFKHILYKFEKNAVLCCSSGQRGRYFKLTVFMKCALALFVHKRLFLTFYFIIIYYLYAAICVLIVLSSDKEKIETNPSQI